MSAPPIYSAILPGDYVVGSNYTRQFGTGDPLGSGTPQSSPFSIGIGGIPAGATIVKAYANWSYQTPTPFLGSAAEADIAINGTPVAGSLTGSAAPDLLWSQQGTDAYTADVTGIVTAAGGNGIYTVSGAVDSATPSSYGEGMSMLVVWALPVRRCRKLTSTRACRRPKAGQPWRLTISPWDRTQAARRISSSTRSTASRSSPIKG